MGPLVYTLVEGECCLKDDYFVLPWNRVSLTIAIRLEPKSKIYRHLSKNEHSSISNALAKTNITNIFLFILDLTLMYDIIDV